MNGTSRAWVSKGLIIETLLLIQMTATVPYKCVCILHGTRTVFELITAISQNMKMAISAGFRELIW